MYVLQNITVKRVLTEKYKETMLEKYERSLFQYNREIEQLHFQLKKMDKDRKLQAEQVRREFEQEIHTRQEKMKLIRFQMDQLQLLPIGSELKEKEIQGIVEVHVGDSFDETVTNKSILIKDGIVIEIR